MTPPLSPPLTLDAARRAIADAIAPIADVESVPLARALGRVLAADVVATADVPAHDNAAMDGYALRGRADDAIGTRRIVGIARAGRPFDGVVPADGCVRILTGAAMPAGSDAVVPQEQVVVDGDVVRIDAVVRPGAHRRAAGEDLKRGAVALPRGRRMGPADMGVAASIGVDRLDVVRRLRIAVFSTGDELREIGEPLGPGAIRDANRYTIVGMLGRLDMEAIDLGIVRDDPDALEAVLARACGPDVRADAVITSGGVSVGDADHTRAVMARLGRVDFWSLAIKPGRPMAFGRLSLDARAVPFFGLPGNPVAVMVVFHALVRDALVALAGAEPEPIARIVAACDTALAKAPGRTEFVRAVATRRADGWHVRPTDAQGSGQLHSMTASNCLIVLDGDRGPVAAGEPVEAWPFRGLV